MPNTHTWFSNAINYYRVVDNETYEGLNWLSTNTNASDVVMASAWKPYNIGWWIEGFTEHPTIYATDLRWLVFRKERVYASIANHFFDKTTSVSEMNSIINDNHIKWIFLDKTISGNEETEKKLSKLARHSNSF